MLNYESSTNAVVYIDFFNWEWVDSLLEVGKLELLGKFLDSLDQAEPPVDPDIPEEGGEISPEPSNRPKSPDPEPGDLPDIQDVPRETDIPYEYDTEEEKSETPSSDHELDSEDLDLLEQQRQANNESPSRGGGKRRLSDSAQESPNKRTK